MSTDRLAEGSPEDQAVPLRSYRHLSDTQVPPLAAGERVQSPAQPVAGGAGVRGEIYNSLFNPNLPGNYQRQFDRIIVWLIVLNLAALTVELVPQIHEPYKIWFDRFDVFSVIVFTVEYLLRLYTAPEDSQFRSANRPRLAFVRNPFAIVDLLAILPFYLQAILPLDLRVLRVLRLLRLLKLFRLLVPAWHEFRELNRGRSFRQHVHALIYPGRYRGEAACVLRHLYCLLGCGVCLLRHSGVGAFSVLPAPPRVDCSGCRGGFHFYP
jgi:hypothetical protein